MLSFFYVAIPVGSALGYALRRSDCGSTMAGAGLLSRGRFPGCFSPDFVFFMRDPRTGRVPARNAMRQRSKIADVFALLRIRSYVLNTAAMTAMTFAIGGISFWLPSYLFEYRGATFGEHRALGEINMIFGGITVVAGCSRHCSAAGRRSRSTRLPSAYFLVSGMRHSLRFPATLAMLRPLPLGVGPDFLAVFFLFFNTGPANAALANVTPPAIRATAFALNIFIIHALGDAISPPLIGWIAGKGTWMSPSWSWWR